jgi:TadE-like protein
MHDTHSCRQQGTVVKVRRKENGRRKGQALAETALTFIFFMLLVFGVIDFARLFYVQMTMQHALREAARFAATGNHMTNSAGVTLSRTNSILQVAQQNAMGIPLNSIQFYSLNYGSNSPGGPSDTETISINCYVQLLTPFLSLYFTNGVYHFSASVMYRNEPFPPSQIN